MKFRPGPLVGQMSGSIGSMVASHNRFGTYMRTRVTPVNPDSEDQQIVRNNFGALSSGWRLLDEPTRKAWATFAETNPITDRLGQSQNLTGAMVYIALNSRRLLTSNLPRLLPPQRPAPLSFASITLSADIGAGDCEIAFTATPLPAQMMLWLSACITDSASVNYVRGKFRFIMYSAAAAASPVNIKSELIAKFGSLQLGKYLHVKVQVYDSYNGQISQPLTASSIITDTP